MSALSEIFPGIPRVESPLFHQMIDELQLSAEERRVAIDLHEQGYAVIDFPDDALDERIERIQAYLAPQFGVDLSNPQSVNEPGQRIQDAWIYSEDIRSIASNPAILDLLGKLYGRAAFPFQTLNFPVGTQQHLHSDSIHFSSIPERFMCGVWLAMEDVEADAGPLTYLPGSHRWPVLNNTMIARQGFNEPRERAQAPFEKAWDALVKGSSRTQEVFLARKGQALIWAANLLHGGSPQDDMRLTRWSQVTHYYFENCIYYTPAFSDEPLGKLDLRQVTNIASGEIEPNLFLGQTLPSRDEDAANEKPRRKPWSFRARNHGQLPADFDAEAYLYLNPDVAAARLDAAEHYLAHGAREGRRFRRI